MYGKKFKIKEEKATILDIKSAVSIALFNGELNNKDIELDTDVRRAITYNKIIFEDLSKRLFSYYNSREDKKNKLKEIIYENFIDGWIYHLDISSEKNEYMIVSDKNIYTYKRVKL